MDFKALMVHYDPEEIMKVGKEWKEGHFCSLIAKVYPEKLLQVVWYGRMLCVVEFLGIGSNPNSIIF